MDHDEALFLNVDHLSEAEHININLSYFSNLDKNWHTITTI